MKFKNVLTAEDKLHIYRVMKKIRLFEKACEQGGIAGEIIAFIQDDAFDYLDSPILRICGPNTPVPYAPKLEDFFTLSPERVARKIYNFFRF